MSNTILSEQGFHAEQNRDNTLNVHFSKAVFWLDAEYLHWGRKMGKESGFLEAQEIEKVENYGRIQDRTFTFRVIPKLKAENFQIFSCESQAKVNEWIHKVSEVAHLPCELPKGDVSTLIADALP